MLKKQMNKLNLRVTDLKNLKCLLGPPATKSLAPKGHISPTQCSPESSGDVFIRHMLLVNLCVLPGLGLPIYSVVQLHHPRNSGFS